MKPTTKLDIARTPDGSKMVLYEHDDHFLIKINGQELMNSRQHESELELARLACSHLTTHEAPRILIGGLGMGYTLRQALDILPANAEILVAELVESVVHWNRQWLGRLNNHPLADARVQVKTGDVVKLLAGARNRFDAILLDIDNGPSAVTDAGNRRLYCKSGIEYCRQALRDKGCLAIWSGRPNKPFERLLMSCDFHVRRYRSPAYKESKKRSHFVWVASENKEILPPNGGEPHLVARHTPPPRTRYPRGR